jgi:hypothetical protein
MHGARLVRRRPRVGGRAKAAGVAAATLSFSPWLTSVQISSFLLLALRLVRQSLSGDGSLGEGCCDR